MPLLARRRSIVALLIALLTTGPAFGWNAAGHRIIASIAFRQLTSQERDAVVKLLKRHPRYLEDFDEKMPDEVHDANADTKEEWLFQQAATWPDQVRVGPRAVTKFHRATWHYVNLPIFLNEKDSTALAGKLKVNKALAPPADATAETEEMNLPQVIRFAKEHCADKKASPLTRAVMLCWLMHNVGDAHQPLHSTALFSERLFPEGDRGGNRVLTEKKENLHSLWDGFPGDRDFRSTRNIAIKFVSEKDKAAMGREAVHTLEEKQWLIESHNFARSIAYDASLLRQLRTIEAGQGDVEPLDVTEAYLKSGGRVAVRRVVQAGYRLGAVLKAIVAESP